MRIIIQGDKVGDVSGLLSVGGKESFTKKHTVLKDKWEFSREKVGDNNDMVVNV